jgi:hypothetical protein
MFLVVIFVSLLAPSIEGLKVRASPAFPIAKPLDFADYSAIGAAGRG